MRSNSKARPFVVKFSKCIDLFFKISFLKVTLWWKFTLGGCQIHKLQEMPVWAFLLLPFIDLFMSDHQTHAVYLRSDKSLGAIIIAESPSADIFMRLSYCIPRVYNGNLTHTSLISELNESTTHDFSLTYLAFAVTCLCKPTFSQESNLLTRQLLKLCIWNVCKKKPRK